MSRQPKGSTSGKAPRRPSNEGEQSKHVYRAQRDPTAPVGKECTVTADGDPLNCRYDLLSASPAGFEWNYRGSGPAQLAIAVLAHAYGDEFAKSRYQQFKRDIVSELPEDGWILTKRDLDEWRREVVDNA
jgi:uncharacterized protein (DUF2249 family)